MPPIENFECPRVVTGAKVVGNRAVRAAYARTPNLTGGAEQVKEVYG